MLKVKNLVCYFRSVSHMEPGEMTTPEGQKIKYEGCYKVEVDLIDDETGRPATRIFRIKDTPKGQELASQLSMTAIMTKLVLDVDIVLSKTNNAKVWITGCYNDALQNETSITGEKVKK